jgi:inner membrane protein
MDNLTHSLVGAVLGQAGLKRKTGLAMPALIIGANLPDVDVTCFAWLTGTEHLAFRRGITHGPPALVLLPLILAGLLWGFDRWQTRRGTRPEGRLPVQFGWLFALSFIACLTHPAMDWLNVYGIRLLEPFSHQWFYGDTLFIIDPWIWAMLIAGIWVSRRRETAGAVKWARPAQVGLAAMLAYIGVNGWITTRAEEEAEDAAQARFFAEHGRWVIASPVPLQFWKRETIYTDGTIKGDTLFERYRLGDWSLFGGIASETSIPDTPCGRRAGFGKDLGSQADAFLFWSRAPFLTRAADGSVVLRDARFTDPRVGDRFSVALPNVRCEPLP